ncbi:MAG: LysR family transcriptional regulator [Cellvibrionaceae bacterium]
MNWELLKVFLAIAETGTLSGAAKYLGVNHSTIFRRLQTLESSVGARLLEKVNNKYILTQLGEDVLLESRKISDSFDRVDRQIMGADFNPKGTVRITAPYNIVNFYLSRVLADFCFQYPDIEINLLSSNLDFNLDQRQADIAIRVTASPPEHWVGRQLCQIPWKVFGSHRYIEENGLPDNLSDLKHHRLIGACGAMLKLPGFLWLDDHHMDNVGVRCDELIAMSYFAEQGHGLAILPMDQMREGIVPLLDYPHGKFSTLWLLTHPDLRKVERIRLVMTHLAQALPLAIEGP